MERVLVKPGWSRVNDVINRFALPLFLFHTTGMAIAIGLSWWLFGSLDPPGAAGPVVVAGTPHRHHRPADLHPPGHLPLRPPPHPCRTIAGQTLKNEVSHYLGL